MQTPEILYEDDQILVCHKPAGVPVQTKKIGTQDMESILKNYLFIHSSHHAGHKSPYLAVIRFPASWFLPAHLRLRKI